MFSRLIIFFKKFDWILLMPVIVLVCLGLIEIYSIALGQGNQQSMLNFKKQIIFAGIGFIIMFVLSLSDYYILRGNSSYIYLGGIAILSLVLFFGQKVRGTTGWFYFAGFGIQPVEFAKVALIFFLARYFSGISSKSKSFKQLFISGVATIIYVGIILLQPDFGSAFIIFVLWLLIISLAGFPKKHFIAIFMVLAISGVLAWSMFFQNYQKQRILTFLEPSYNPLEQGYNVAQAIIAVGAGGLTGRGIGFGSQSQLKFLPESQNDFIFAVVAEELGFIGVSLVIILFLIFFWRIFSKIKNISNDFGVYFVLGGAGLIFIEMFINIGMNIGLLPVIGISLPFVSYGGSGLIAKLALVGAMESIIIKSNT